jgi:hypothetical protein
VRWQQTLDFVAPEAGIIQLEVERSRIPTMAPNKKQGKKMSVWILQHHKGRLLGAGVFIMVPINVTQCEGKQGRYCNNACIEIVFIH